MSKSQERLEKKQAEVRKAGKKRIMEAVARGYTSRLLMNSIQVFTRKSHLEFLLELVKEGKLKSKKFGNKEHFFLPEQDMTLIPQKPKFSKVITKTWGITDRGEYHVR